MSRDVWTAQDIRMIAIWEETLANSFINSDYIQVRTPVYTSHSAGRYAVKRFRKAQCPIIERLTNSLMMNGRNNGKKLMAVRIVAHAFEIVRPCQTLCRALKSRTSKPVRSTAWIRAR